MSGMEKEDKTGWIKLHRKIMTHWIWYDPIYLKAWIAILMQVNHEGKKVLIQGELIECKRGESLMSLQSWAKYFGKEWTIQKVRTFFELLKKDEMIITKGMRKSTRLTVCNYAIYQNQQQADNKQITSRQQADNNKQECIKNEKNEKNVFSEKIKSEFEIFIKEQKKPVSETRKHELLNHLLKLAPDSDEAKSKIITQAIRGGYSDFRPVQPDPGAINLKDLNDEKNRYRR